MRYAKNLVLLLSLLGLALSLSFVSRESGTSRSVAAASRDSNR